jgi:hypothetical protein
MESEFGIKGALVLADEWSTIVNRVPLMKVLDLAIKRISELGKGSDSEHPETYATIVLVVFLALFTLMLLI